MEIVKYFKIKTIYKKKKSNSLYPILNQLLNFSKGIKAEEMSQNDLGNGNTIFFKVYLFIYVTSTGNLGI